jgi:hypothetical protein
VRRRAFASRPLRWYIFDSRTSSLSVTNTMPHGLNSTPTGKGLIVYHTLCDHVLTRRHWQVPFPHGRQRQNFIHYDTTLLPYFRRRFEYDFHRIPWYSTRKNPFSDSLRDLVHRDSVHGVAYITSAHTSHAVRLITRASLDRVPSISSRVFNLARGPKSRAPQR